MRPKIGITTWRRTLDTFYGPDRLMTLSTFYTDAITEAEMVPVLFAAATDPAEAGRLVDMVDGVVVSGGGDVDPTSYGQENVSSTDNSPDVDNFEIAVVEAARVTGKPLLAICRGLQVLNVAFGGTLRQEVTSSGGVHDLITRDHEEMNARRHAVTFEEGAWLSDLYRGSEAKVNTLHHQGIDRLGEGLIVEGRTDDGLIEAVRCDGDWWALGVQWHPERMDGEHRCVFDALREACSPA